VIVNTRVRIALIAHDGQKQDMVEWAAWNRVVLRGADLCGTRHTASLVAGAIGAPVRALLSGPRGGDAQIGAMIAKRELDLVVFFWDPLACNRRSADLIVTSRVWKPSEPPAQVSA
jgi:methylglyoxal synthase